MRESGVKAEPLREMSGLPQGSIMSGIFHIVNSNDLPACRDDAESIVYVDDDTDNVQDGDPENLAAKLQLEVQETVNWLKTIACVWQETKANC